MTALSPLLAHIDQILKRNSIEEIWALHVARMSEYGFDRMIYGFSRFRTFGDFGDPSDAIILIKHDQEYVDRYFGESLYNHAPMTVWAANNTGVESWQWAWDRRKAGLTSEAENRVLDLNRKMGVLAGYSISFDSVFERSKSAIGLCARRDLDQTAVDMIWQEKGDEIVLLNNLVNVKIATLPFECQARALTPRQREVLQWVADGKTIQDIAIIMNLNQATIEKHLRLARESLGAETTAQAVLFASMQNQFFTNDGVCLPLGNNIQFGDKNINAR
ncbi:MAG: LuxR family transcriptional regulator [Rhodobacteraceae bacterium]|nr:LuxR family transcriptional regulator [Paracoccaceae bacterium]